jgi:hypothetical protein
MNWIKEIFAGFQSNPCATLCCLLVVGFAWVYNDMQSINAEQRSFMVEMHKSQNLMNESLKELNVRMSNIEQNFTTTPQQLKELIMLLHHHEIGQTQPTE